MDEPKRPVSGLRETAPYLGLGIQLAAVVLVFFFIGTWADKRFETTPWLMLAGVVIAVAGGLIQFVRAVSELSKKESTKKHDGFA